MLLGGQYTGGGVYWEHCNIRIACVLDTRGVGVGVPTIEKGWFLSSDLQCRRATCSVFVPLDYKFHLKW